MAQLDPSEHTIDELDDEIEEIEDPEQLEEIREAETNGEDRTGAIETIEERLKAVNAELERRGETTDGSDDGSDTDDDTGGGGGVSGGSSDIGLVDVRNRVRNSAADLIGRDLDGIIGVRADDDGWEATVEVVERHSVPDTQDILGRYLLTLDSSGRIVEYSRLGRYRRGDTAPFEEV